MVRREALRSYRRKRNFTRTPEPSGEAGAAAAGNSFVIQKHAARAMHHDFRLELDGVLQSWAVPKGAPVEPGDKVLAVRTEDHPLAYGSFEGVIPRGEYGGGTVMLWDRGTWQAEGDARVGLRAGKLDFELHGERLCGRWSLVKMGGQRGRNGATGKQAGKENWLLIKRSDRDRNGRAASPELDRSVASGRSMAQIARSQDGDGPAVRHSQQAGRRAQVTRKPPRAVLEPGSLPGARQRPQPRALQPQLATLVSFQGLREDKAPAEVRREQVRPPVVRMRARPARDEASGSVFAGVNISHPDRVLYPELGITKEGLARYYEQVAERLLPHVVNRPLSVLRCPQGAGGKCFYQKHRTQGMPAAVRAVAVGPQDGTADYLVIDDAEGLLSLVQFGAIELHPWGSRADLLERPDRLVIDLDPDPTVPWSQMVEAARMLHGLLDDLGLVSFARTTGGKGLHVVVPIERRSSWAEAKAFTRQLVGVLAAGAPARYVLTASKTARQGRIFLDYLRNDRGATAVANWSARARAGATVATPLRWTEVTTAPDPAAFTLVSVVARLRSADPWVGFFDVRQALTKRVSAALRKS